MSTEGAFQSAIFDLLSYPQHRSILAMHIKPARVRDRIITPTQGHSGFPDMVLCGPGGLVFRELKQAGRYPNAEQRRWLDTLTDAGADAGVWRPADITDVVATLRRLAA